MNDQLPPLPPNSKYFVRDIERGEGFDFLFPFDIYGKVMPYGLTGAIPQTWRDHIAAVAIEEWESQIPADAICDVEANAAQEAWRKWRDKK